MSTQILTVNHLRSEDVAQKLDEIAVVSKLKTEKKNTLLAKLISQGQKGDPQALESIYEQFKRPLFSYIYRFTYNYQIAEDLLQETFLKAFSHLDDVEKVELFKSWLYRIAVNNCYSYLRGNKDKLKKSVSLTDMEERIPGKISDSRNDEIKNSLSKAIQHLAPKLKSVFILHDVQGYKHKEIATMMGWAVGTSKSQLFKARLRIRDYLKDN